MPDTRRRGAADDTDPLRGAADGACPRRLGEAQLKRHVRTVYRERGGRCEHGVGEVGNGGGLR
eukprot:1740489-Pyramimonas_sp.AAC.1